MTALTDLTDLLAVIERTVLESVAEDAGDAGARVLSFPWIPEDGRLSLGGLPVETLVFQPRTAHAPDIVKVQSAARELARWALDVRDSLS